MIITQRNNITEFITPWAKKALKIRIEQTSNSSSINVNNKKNLNFSHYSVLALLCAFMRSSEVWLVTKHSLESELFSELVDPVHKTSFNYSFMNRVLKFTLQCLTVHWRGRLSVAQVAWGEANDGICMLFYYSFNVTMGSKRFHLDLCQNRDEKTIATSVTCWY